MSDINKNTTAENMTIGGNIYEAGMQEILKQAIGEVLNLFI